MTPAASSPESTFNDPNELPLEERRELVALLRAPRRKSDPDPAPNVTLCYEGDDGNVLFNEQASAAFSDHLRRRDEATAALPAEARAAGKAAIADWHRALASDPEIQAARQRAREAREHGEHYSFDVRDRFKALKREAFRRRFAKLRSGAGADVARPTRGRGHEARSGSNARPRGSKRSASSRSAGGGSDPDEPDGGLAARPCICGGLIEKPARGPWPTECVACKRAERARKMRERRNDPAARYQELSGEEILTVWGALGGERLLAAVVAGGDGLFPYRPPVATEKGRVAA